VKQTGQTVSYQTRALGCSVDLVITDLRAHVVAVAICNEELDRIDALASRFRPDSELSRLALRAGRPVPVSEGLFEALSVAVEAAVTTNGAVDPTVGGALSRLGYDRDFDEVAPGVSGTLPEPCPVPGWKSIELDERRQTVQIPRGVGIDLGATAKALAADRIVRRIHQTCGCGSVVSLGGDVAVAGESPPGGFRIGIEDSDCSAVTVAIQSGGMATSGVTGRRWLLGEREVHHLLDPSSGLPLQGPWRMVTVSAASCVEANIASTASVVFGAGAVRWLEDRGLHGRLVTNDGTVFLAGGWPPDRAPLSGRTSVRC
jgi:thiamine biosynthesis lipoprotein ApbE